MNRRDVLKRIATVSSVGALAGCVGAGSGGQEPSGDDETATHTRTGATQSSADAARTSTDTTTRSTALSIVSKRIETKETNCLAGQVGATIQYSDGTATVDGTIRAPDPCHEATLKQVSYDAANDRLTIVVATVEGDADYCQQCLGAIDYRAAVELSGGTPDRIVVRHADEDGTTTVATATID